MALPLTQDVGLGPGAVARMDLALCSQPSVDPSVRMHSTHARSHRKLSGTPMGIRCHPGGRVSLTCPVGFGAALPCVVQAPVP